MIVTSFFIYFVIFPTIAFVSFPNSLNISLEQRAANEDVMILFQTNASTAENEISEGDGGDAIGGGTGTARGGDGGDGGDAIGGGTGTARGGDGGDGGDAIDTSSCSDVLGGNGGNGGTAAAGADVEIGREGEKGETDYCEILDPDEG
jgi:hypothetical protein